jgi:chromosome partitioning protein
MTEQPNADFVGINEISEMAGVSRQAVTNWRARATDFPAPVSELASGPIFRRSQIRSWLRRKKRKLPMTHIISVINFKGGVGKTTTTVALAETLSGEMGKRVLVIDLDPQTNATLMLIGEDRWFDLNAKGHTLATVFKDALDPENKRFNLEMALQKRVSDVDAARTIDLLPSSLDLIDVQDRLAGVPSGKFYAVNPVDLLSRAVKSVLENYELVLIDCPPNLGIITLNGLRISDGYIIPTIPDHLSTYGIPQILTRVKEFARAIDEAIEPLGIAVTKYQANSSVHNNTLRQLKQDLDLPKVYERVIKQSNTMSAAAEFTTSKRTLRQKYGAGANGLASDFIGLASELLSSLEVEA